MKLVPVLLRVAAAGDGPAAAVVERLAEEVFLLARATLDRLNLRDQPTDVVLGGSVLAARHPLLMEGVAASGGVRPTCQAAGGRRPSGDRRCTSRPGRSRRLAGREDRSPDAVLARTRTTRSPEKEAS